MELKEGLSISQVVEKYLTPLLATCENHNRFDLIQGGLVTILAICDCTEEEVMKLFAGISGSIQARVTIQQNGNAEILGMIGYDAEDIDEIKKRLMGTEH